MARIAWTCRIEAEPGELIVEVPVWGGTINITDLASTATLRAVGETAYRLVGAQFVESLLVATGVAERGGDGLSCSHSVSVTARRIGEDRG